HAGRCRGGVAPARSGGSTRRMARGPRGGTRRGPPEVAMSPRPTIETDEHDLARLTEEATDALLQANTPFPRIFRFGGTLARVEHDLDEQPVTQVLTPDRLRHHLAHVARWIQHVRSRKTDQRGP